MRRWFWSIFKTKRASGWSGLFVIPVCARHSVSPVMSTSLAAWLTCLLLLALVAWQTVPSWSDVLDIWAPSSLPFPNGARPRFLSTTEAAAWQADATLRPAKTLAVDARVAAMGVDSVPGALARLSKTQQLGQLFGLEVGAFLACPEAGSNDRFRLDTSQVELALGLFCVGTIYVAQVDIVKPGCTFSLTETDITHILERLRALTQCPIPPLVMWLPDYADTPSSIPSILADAESSGAFMRWPFPAAARPTSVAAMTPGTPLPFSLDDLPLSASGAAAAQQPELVRQVSAAVGARARALGFHILGTVPLLRGRRTSTGLLEVPSDLVNSFGDELEMLSTFGTHVAMRSVQCAGAPVFHSYDVAMFVCQHRLVCHLRLTKYFCVCPLPRSIQSLSHSTAAATTTVNPCSL